MTTDPSACGCIYCPQGMLRQMKVEFSGITNDQCSDCGDLNTAAYYLDFDEASGSCLWSLSPQSAPCGLQELQVYFYPSGGQLAIAVNVTFSDGVVRWTQSDVGSCRENEYITDFESSTSSQCGFSVSTSTVTPVGLELNLDASVHWSCFFWGSCLQPFSMPFLGSLIALPAPLMFPLAETVQAVATMAANPGDAPAGGCTGGGGECADPAIGPDPLAGNPVANDAETVFDAATEVCGIGSCLLNLSNGRFTNWIVPVLSGPLAPILMLTHNSQSTVDVGFGAGWLLNVDRKVDDQTDYVEVDNGAGSKYRFSDPDTSDVYKPAGPVTNSLKKESDGTWTETQSDGAEIKYASGGKATKILNAKGAIWTITRDVGNKVESVTDPSGARTTIAYASGKIDKITDSHGRETDFTVTSGKLVDFTTPEQCKTEFKYDGSSRLEGIVDPEGFRTTLSYDSLDWVTAIQAADGTRTTYTWQDWSTTKITDALGNISTLTYNVARNIEAVENPLGHRTSFVWSNNQMLATIDALGNRNTLSYQTLDNRTNQLEAVTQPSGTKVTYQYDSNSRVKALVDQLGNRTTLSWDANGLRQTIKNALGHRTTFAYSSKGQLTATIDAIGCYCTNTYDASGLQKAEMNPLGERKSYEFSSTPGDFACRRSSYRASYCLLMCG
ncbi:MAG: RHS repeat protein [Planctomycetes bacterium]|nr:RHS repeat protein [Planctomycetota bacterium]